jgi:zinc protease
MSQHRIYKRQLSNGLTVLCWPQYQVPKVSIQLWYDVGSKDELSNQKGIAHLLEHMIFKGTASLSESDINLITHKLSGYSNAFTSHDYTGYIFDLPVQHWHYALPILADCMTNCTFKEDLLNAELKAVIQELKMYNDDYSSVVLERLLGAIFPDHPYHYPVIGYKKDLWSLDRKALLEFYKKHYVPNNATILVVGAVDPETVFEKSEAAFGSIPAAVGYKRAEYHHFQDIIAQRVSIVRDVQQPSAMLAWVVPGARERSDYLLDVTSSLIGSGKGSRLNRLIVDELELATQLESFVYDLMDYGLFVITFQPKKAEDIEVIAHVVKEELAKIVAEGLTDDELRRACNKAEMDFMSVTEDPERCAYLLGKSFLATKDENYLLSYTAYPKQSLQDDVKNLIKNYLRPAVTHQGMVVPLSEGEKIFWQNAQKQSDEEDSRVLSRIQRETPVEPGKVVHAVGVHAQPSFNFPAPTAITLSNGLKVLYYHNPHVAKVDMVLEFKARGYYDPVDKQGLMMFVMDVIQEGTNNYPGYRFNQEIESHGMTLSTTPGQVTLSLLKKDLERGIRLLVEMLNEAEFEKSAIERIRTQIRSDITDFWDTPAQFVGQIAREAVYGYHPYHKSYYGTHESIGSIHRDELIEAYKTYLSPQDATLVIVGDLEGHDLPTVLEKVFSEWTGASITEMKFPTLRGVAQQEVNRHINRDQVVLAFAGLSVRRKDDDYDRLLLFDQVLTGGVLGSSSSRLFQIREQTGLFYTAGGSLLTGSHFEPGMIFIKTIVTPEKLSEAEHLIGQVLEKQAHDLTMDELGEAKRAVTHALVDNFSTNRSIASSFMFLEKFKLPYDFFNTRAHHITSVSLTDVQDAVARHLDVSRMARIRIGRLS